MKRMIQRGFGLLMILALTFALAVSASAVDADSVSVQLNGETLTFSDAVPTIREGRTMIPMRAVFEALGAEVSYEDAAKTVTAVRGETTVTMVIGQSTVQVKEGETARSFTMDVAPYVDAASGRTYVPVRFAAEALGCNVGWDEDDRTVLIVDVDALVEQAGPFTLMDKVMSSQQAVSTGNQKLTGTFDGKLSVQDPELGTVPMSLTGEYHALGNDKAVEMSMDMKMDLSEMANAAGMDPAEVAALSSLGMDAIVDMESGAYYMNLGSLSGMLMGTTEPVDNLWFKMDMAQLMEEMGLDWTELTSEQAVQMSMADTLAEVLRQVPLTDKDGDWDALQSVTAVFQALLSDKAFVKDGDNYVCNYALTLPADGQTVALNYKLTLKMSGEDVAGVELAANVDMGSEGMVSLSASAMGETMKLEMTMDVADELALSMKMDVTETTLKMDMSMDMAGMMEMEFHMNGTQTETTEVPATEPPAGAQIVDLNQMMGDVPTYLDAA